MKERGITLIALVITIIVLLILAGVSISLTLGKNGVLIQATNAVSNSREATAKEDVEMAWASATTKYWSDWASNSSKQRNEKFYKDELEGKETSNGRIEEITLSGSIYTVLYTDNDQGDLYTFEIGLDGNATQIDKEKANTVLAYLVDTANIGDYIDISFNSENGTYSNGWRVLSKSGSGKSGFVTLISAGCPLTYYHPSETNGSNPSLADLDNLSSITIISEGRGFTSDTITGSTAGTVDLATQFSSNSYFDASKGIHAFGCNTLNNGTEHGTNTELETLYKYITGAETIAMSSLYGGDLTDASLVTKARNNGKTMDPKCNGLITCGTIYWLGGASFNIARLWFISSGGSVYDGKYGNKGVRPVVSLKSGIKMADGTYSGTSADPLKLK